MRVHVQNSGQTTLVLLLCTLTSGGAAYYFLTLPYGNTTTFATGCFMGLLSLVGAKTVFSGFSRL